MKQKQKISEIDLKFLKMDFPNNWKYLRKKLACPYEYFNGIDDYQKPFYYLKKKPSSVN